MATKPSNPTWELLLVTSEDSCGRVCFVKVKTTQSSLTTTYFIFPSLRRDSVFVRCGGVDYHLATSPFPHLQEPVLRSTSEESTSPLRKPDSRPKRQDNRNNYSWVFLLCNVMLKLRGKGQIFSVFLVVRQNRVSGSV